MNTRKLRCLLFVLSIPIGAVAQSHQPSAPNINPFSLKPDNLGAIANSVNLFTGDLNLPLNMVSLPGRGGLSIELSISYSSFNIENQVDIWNLESPTGVLGLGWNLPYPTIIVDNKQTGARDDDEFYLMEGGSSNRLTCTGNSSGVKSYQARMSPNWVVTFTSSSEKWEITKDNGTKYIYGDSGSGRNTVQWVIKWGNWIGSSKQLSNERQGLIWNLSESL